jgi:hypothetical protein
VKQRGRISAAALNMMIGGPRTDVLERIERPQPPRELTSREERDTWHLVVDAAPAEWFTPGTYPVLVQFCRHVVQARRIAEQLADAPPTTMEERNVMLAMQERESRTIAMLATKMRLTQQSLVNLNGHPVGGRKKKAPWQEENE